MEWKIRRNAIANRHVLVQLILDRPDYETACTIIRLDLIKEQGVTALL